MKKENITEALEECKNISNDIINTIKNILKKENITFSENNDSELVISKFNKNDIKEKLIANGINKRQLKILIQITEINNNTFIRQKFI